MALFLFWRVFCVSILLCVLVEARLPDGRMRANQPPIPIIPGLQQKIRVEAVADVNGAASLPYDTVYYFDQLIDHKNPSKGAFKQRSWVAWGSYKPG